MSETNGNDSGELIPRDEDMTIAVPRTASLARYMIDDNLICSVKLDTEAGFMTYMQMRHGEQIPLASRIDQVLLLRNFFVEGKESKPNADGEVVRYPRICLEDHEGKVYSCGSFGVFGSLSDILRFRKEAPWEPPVKVKVQAKQLSGGKRWFTLMPVFDVQPTLSSGGPKNGGQKK